MSHQSRSTIVGLLERHGLMPRKAYGQHFLADPNLIEKVVSLAGVAPGDRVVEVGAGTGALTMALSEAGAEVMAFEIDQRFRPLLAEILLDRDVDLRFVDVMTVDFGIELVGSSWKLVANLPYNVGTPLLLDLLLTVPQVETMVVMVQKEVADRLVASVGDEEYGLPSVVVGLTATVTDRFPVPPQVFVPAPQVGSAVVRLARLESPPQLMGAMAIARAAFGQRRKMVRRSLAEIATLDEIVAAGIDPAARPEELRPEAFVRLAEVVNGG